jgi:hypothetical protein
MEVRRGSDRRGGIVWLTVIPLAVSGPLVIGVVVVAAIAFAAFLLRSEG